MTTPDPEWEAYMEGQAEAGADVFEPSAEEIERDVLLAGVEPNVRDAYLRAEAEPKVFPAEPEAGL